MPVDPDLATFLARVDTCIEGFEGRRVVEIGGDHAASTLQAVGELFAPRELVGLNPAFESRTISPWMRVQRSGAQDSGLEDDSVGAVFSLSAFEHIADLGAVLEEMHRVLEPGGLLYSHFGPLWSTTYGHHLWVHHDGNVYTYHDIILPPWCHLLNTRDEVREMLAPLGAGVAEVLAEFAFDSEEQNGLFFDDYERIVDASPFDTVFLKGYDFPELAAKYPLSQSPAVLAELEARYPEHHGWLYDGITLLLRKPA